MVVFALVAGGAGAGLTWMALERSARPAVAVPAAPPTGEPRPEAVMTAPVAPAGGLLPDLELALAPDVASRAAIEVTTTSSAALDERLRLPGIVEPNGYRRVVVTPFARGRVTAVPAELGAAVTRGTTIVHIESPELAEAQSVWLSMRAELDAATERLRRSERLVQIGGASRQELEQARAEQVVHEADVESARARLRLLGMTDQEVDALSAARRMSSAVSVVAPIDGTVIGRRVNPGQVVEAGTEMIELADLATVWVMANIYERDLTRVRVGDAVTVVAPAASGRAWTGRIDYVDPQVSIETRTARVRVELPNADRRLKLAMYVDVVLHESAGRSGVLVSSEAVQTVGDRHFVYLPDPARAGRFTEREVHLGRTIDRQVEVVDGLRAGDTVVTSGSFLLRAERERLGLRANDGADPAGPASRPESRPLARPAASRLDPIGRGAVRRIVVEVLGTRFSPDRIPAEAGVPIELVFTRTVEQTCATEVVIPSLGIRQALPLNAPVAVRLTPDRAGDIAFACGMSMLKGAVVIVREHPH